MPFKIERYPEFPYPPQIESHEDTKEYLQSLHRSMQEFFSLRGQEAQNALAGVDLDDLANTTLVDPNADRIVFWDDGAGVYTWLTANTGLAISATNLNLSHLGLEALTAPGADRIFFWDHSTLASKWLACDDTTIAITDTTLAVIAGGVDHGGLAGLGDDDHPQYILHSLADAASDFLVASAADTIIKKTLAETGAILEGDIQHDNLQGVTANEHIDWTNATDKLITTLAVECISVNIADTNASHHLILAWNEDDTADRVLLFEVNGANRVLTIEANSLVNQDLTTDADPTFGSVTVATGLYLANNVPLYGRNVADDGDITIYKINVNDHSIINATSGKDLIFTENLSAKMRLRGGNLGIAMIPTGNGLLCLGLPTENFEIIDAGSAAATEQDWVEVEVGGVQGYIRVYASK